MGIVTDSTPMEEPKDPEANTVYQLFKLVAPAEAVADMAAKFRPATTAMPREEGTAGRTARRLPQGARDLRPADGRPGVPSTLNWRRGR